MLAFISFFSGVYYMYQVCDGQERLMGSGSLFTGGREPREAAHMLLWTLLAPQQWVMPCSFELLSRHCESFSRRCLWCSTGCSMCFLKHFFLKEKKEHVCFAFSSSRRLGMSWGCEICQVMHARLYTKVSWLEAGSLMLSTAPGSLF